MDEEKLEKEIFGVYSILETNNPEDSSEEELGDYNLEIYNLEE